MTGRVTTMTMNDAARLCHAVCALLGPATQLVEAQERPWASATFSGARHIVRVRTPLASRDAPAPAGLAALPEHEFALPNHIVADCAVTVQQRSVDADRQWWLHCDVEILTIEAD